MGNPYPVRKTTDVAARIPVATVLPSKIKTPTRRSNGNGPVRREGRGGIRFRYRHRTRRTVTPLVTSKRRARLLVSAPDPAPDSHPVREFGVGARRTLVLAVPPVASAALVGHSAFAADANTTATPPHERGRTAGVVRTPDTDKGLDPADQTIAANLGTRVIDEHPAGRLVRPDAGDGFHSPGGCQAPAGKVCLRIHNMSGRSSVPLWSLRAPDGTFLQYGHGRPGDTTDCNSAGFVGPTSFPALRSGGPS
jgi:hypothetical protein